MADVARELNISCSVNKAIVARTLTHTVNSAISLGHDSGR
jgi:hypothetical protein